MLTTPVSAHVSDCLIASKSKDIVVAAFKKDLLTRCVVTDEGPLKGRLLNASDASCFATVQLKRQVIYVRVVKGVHGRPPN
jgi:hypothetical protein